MDKDGNEDGDIDHHKVEGVAIIDYQHNENWDGNEEPATKLQQDEDRMIMIRMEIGMIMQILLITRFRV